MDDFLFGWKRAYWSTVRFSARELARFGLTPARVDMMRLLFQWPGMPQKRLRHHLGVSRATVSRMIRALEELGLVERGPAELDRRSRACRLTHSGHQKISEIWATLVSSGSVSAAIDDALRAEFASLRQCADRIAMSLVVAFGRWGPISLELTRRHAA